MVVVFTDRSVATDADADRYPAYITYMSKVVLNSIYKKKKKRIYMEMERNGRTYGER